MTSKLIAALALAFLAVGCGQEGRPVDQLADDSPSPTVLTTPEATATPVPTVTGSATTAPEQTETPEPTPVGWGRTDEKTFSFEIPEDMKREKVQPIDSQVGHFESDRARLHYDYGMYSGDAADEKAPEYRDSWIRIDDRFAHVSYSRRRPGPRKDDDISTRYEYFASVYFPDVDETSDESPPPSAAPAAPQQTKLTLVVYSHDGWDDAERTITSIKFAD
jgi:hypothetical protein